MKIKKAQYAVLVVLSFILVTGFTTISHYGISWDEPFGIHTVEQNYEVVIGNKPDTGTLTQFYGIAFDGLAELLFQFKKRIPFNPSKLSKAENQTPQEISKQDMLDRIAIKHVLTFSTSLIAYLSVVGIVSILCGPNGAWLGAVVLALFPRWWGHAFFNAKDIPFASLMILCVFFGAHLIKEYLKDGSDQGQHHRNLAFSIFFGILAGLLSGIRIGGVVFLFFIPFTHFVLVDKRKIVSEFIKFAPCYFQMFLAWFMITVLFYPSAWSNPIRQILKTVYRISDYSDWHMQVLFNGQFVLAQSLPRSYLPQWLVMTIPIIFQLGFVAGLVLIILRYRRFSILQKAIVILTGLEVFALPGMAIVKKSTMYDGMRHFLFMLPGVAAIATAAMIWLYQGIVNTKRKILAIILMVFLLIAVIFDMVMLHPYEYVYFNKGFGGLKKAFNQYETDYWGLSLRKAVEWINRNVNIPAQVLIGAADLEIASILVKPHIQCLKYPNDESGENLNKPFYYISLTRWNGHKDFPECPVVFEEARQTVPLAVVKKCG